MEIYRSIAEIQPVRDTLLTIGSFDGLHRGHQEVVKKVVTYAQARRAQSVVITFNPHPRHVLNPRAPHLPLLLSVAKKLELLEQLGVDIAVVIPFTEEFSRMTAAAFLDQVVVAKFQPHSLIIGYDHHFGYQRGGSPDFVREYLRSSAVEVEIIQPFSDEDIIISSTHIRELIQAGYVRRASFELGWVYGFRATVVPGAGRGRKLHFPTANFVPVEKDQLLPGQGVYFTRGRLNSKNIYGMCNLGTRPTFDEDDFVMEVHFFNEIDTELYGRQITIEFLERIRDEKKFDSSDKLIEQLEEDRQRCMLLSSKYK
ncbi:MAG: bifunctional riboflavin kinase/FAD synthetase [Candidatus Neomarinimicrobiota bacterium]